MAITRPLTPEEEAEEELRRRRRRRREEEGPLGDFLEDPFGLKKLARQRKRAEIARLKPPGFDSLQEAARIRAILARIATTPAGRSATIATSARGVTSGASVLRRRLTAVG
jgi:hypothetical protein